MKKISLLFSFLFVLIIAGQAQYSFKVLAVKGNNKVYKGNSWSNVSAGTKLNSSEKIKLTSGGYLGLIHSSGKTLELKQSGEFSIKSLEKKVVAGKSGFGTKYGEFVADGMFSANDGAKNNYKKTGSISRGDKTSIVVYGPERLVALKSVPFTIHWNDCGADHTYTVSIKNLFNEEIHSIETSTNSATIDFNLEKFTIGPQKGNYLLVIESNKDSKYSTKSQNGIKDHSYEINIIDDTKDKKIKTTLDNLKKDSDETSALDQMVIAAFYDQEGLMTYAVDSYSKATTLEPEVDHYKVQYEEYIKTKLSWTNINGSNTK